MEDEEFINGLCGNSTVYNNARDSDIILQCGDRQIYAHRVLLRLWSPFFDRTFNSLFPAAKSAVFLIDTDDNGDHQPIFSVLKHIYGMPLSEHPDNDPNEWLDECDQLDYYTKVFTMADKYDFPSVRIAAVSCLHTELGSVELIKKRYEDIRQNAPDLPEYIARVCGPHAPQLADTRLRDFLLAWIVRNYSSVSEDLEFRQKLDDGSLLDVELTGRLLSKLGVRIRDLTKPNKKLKT